MPDTGTYLVDLRFAISAGNIEEVKKIILQARNQYGKNWTEFDLVMRETIVNDKLEILKYFYQEGAHIDEYQKELSRLARKFNRPVILKWLQEKTSEEKT